MQLPPPLAGRRRDAFATDVYAGLTRAPQKELPSKYLYDAVGSALFEAITHLPQYGLTAAEDRLLRTHAHDICERAGALGTMLELGSGSGRKTRRLLEACTQLQPQTGLTYIPIEISATALAQCEAELGAMAGVRVRGLERDYLDGLKEATQAREGPSAWLLLFLGSTIGNFSRDAALQFLRQLRGSMRAGDLLLLGADLVKPAARLMAAYDDPLGVTACFNLNLLQRMNVELGADFQLDHFAHEARINQRSGAVEMHLRARRAQRVKVPGAGLTAVHFEAGETLWTESSHKYEVNDLHAMTQAAGFAGAGLWIDESWGFAQTLVRAA